MTAASDMPSASPASAPTASGLASDSGSLADGNATPVAICRLKRGDPAHLDACQRLVVEANWNQVAPDWRIFLDHGEVFGVPARDGRLAASAALLPYPAAGCAWISMVLVAGEHRRRGLASLLLQCCIDAARERGLRPVLDATPAGRVVYQTLGFVDGWTITRWRRPASSTSSGPVLDDPRQPHRLRPLSATDWPRLVKLDALAFGGSRAFLLDSLRPRAPFAAVATTEGGRMGKGAEHKRLHEACSITGFVLGREGRVATQIGPVVADREDLAVALLQRVVPRLERPLIIDALDRHTALAQALEDMGFEAERGFTRMMLGSDVAPGDPERLMTIAGPEFG